MNASNDKQGFHTMRVNGHFGKKTLHILIDSGSTHNFIDIELAKKLDYKLEPIIAQRATIAYGNQLTYQYVHKAFK